MARKRRLAFLAGVALTASSFFGPSLRLAAASGADSTDVVTVSQSDWTGNEVTSALAAKLIEKLGDDAKVVPIDGVAVFPATQKGDIDFNVEIWESTSLQLVQAAVKSGQAVSLGSLGPVGEDHWWYPIYVKSECPGLPDWRALNGCAKLFATPETGDKGQLLVYPDSWGTNDEVRVKTLGLNYVVVHAGSEAALDAEVQAAYARHQPILAWLYLPHWMPIRYKGEFVKLPPYTDACYANKTYGCEKPKAAITKMAWIGAQAKWPHAYKLIQEFQLSTVDYSTMVGEVDVDGKSIDAVTNDWLAKNQDIWSKWIAAAQN
jgi:glycine betaine/proline transport system substrate-binding protein